MQDETVGNKSRQNPDAEWKLIALHKIDLKSANPAIRFHKVWSHYVLCGLSFRDLNNFKFLKGNVPDSSLNYIFHYFLEGD